jgi:predicted Zn finger-like uncharacterized protein
MVIPIACPHCNQSYNLADSQEGKTVRCKVCSDTFVVAASSSTPPARRDSGVRRRNPGPEDEVVDVVAVEEDDRSEDRPRRRRRVRKQGIPGWVWIVGGVGLGLMLFLGLGLLLWYAVASGFGTSITRENYGKLAAGMSEAQVVAILGRPTSVGDPIEAFGGLGMRPSPMVGSVRVLTWKSGQAQIQVVLVNDKVTTLSALNLHRLPR